MARTVFLNGQETKVSRGKDEVVVQVVRGDHPNPVKLERGDGGVLPAEWTYITSVGRRPSPAP